MQKTIKIDYEEQAKAVVCNTKVEYSGEEIPTNEEILKEAQSLFNEAQKFAKLKTMEKLK